MLDRFNRKINYLRISVTDRCNLRCVYCMPDKGVKLLRHEEILSFEEISQVVKTGISLGIDKVRLTGGEPLVRKEITELVYMLSKIRGIKDFAMTTNGTFLEKFAQPLADAGLQRINISLDTLKPEIYKKITRCGDITNVFKGIEAANKAELLPIKINCVVKHSSIEEDAQQVAEFCKKNNLQVRFIHEMNLEKGNFSKVEGGDGGDCKICNRLRLTADGKIKPCLFNNLEFDIKDLGIEEAYKRAIESKPESGTINNYNKFSNIGG
ncbi:MAG: radical SAM protein [Bacteroidales bacterium]|nr:radical SAM protein [Bacteroidales bacterium]